MPKRQGNNPKRRIAPAGIEQEYLEGLNARVRYTGSPHHKRIPARYGFDPPANPRPNKSLCDGNGVVELSEATDLFHEGITRGMISTYQIDGLPKYVWAMDARERVFESKLEHGQQSYHGYELGEDEDMMRQQVIEEWMQRCPAN